jgi:hypothetical protein
MYSKKMFSSWLFYTFLIIYTYLNFKKGN